MEKVISFFCLFFQVLLKSKLYDSWRCSSTRLPCFHDSFFLEPDMVVWTLYGFEHDRETIMMMARL